MGKIYIVLVDDIPCGIYTSHVDSDIAFDKLVEEIPKEHYVYLIECERNKRVVGIIRKGNILRKEEGVLCI